MRLGDDEVDAAIRKAIKSGQAKYISGDLTSPDAMAKGVEAADGWMWIKFFIMSRNRSRERVQWHAIIDSIDCNASLQI